MPAPVRRCAGRAASALVAALVLALLALVPCGAPAGAATPRVAANACTVRAWDKASVQRAAQGVDAVLAARITKAVKQTGSWTYTIRVVATFRGSAQSGATATMTQVPVRQRPGTPLTKRATYLLFLHQQGAGFTSDRCAGSVLLRKGLSKALRSKLTADLTTPSGSVVTAQWTAPKGGVRDVPSLNRLIAPGVGLALIGVLGLLLIGRLAREREH